MVDQFVDQRIAFDLQELVGHTEDDAERGTEKRQAEDGGDHEFPLRRSSPRSP